MAAARDSVLMATKSSSFVKRSRLWRTSHNRLDPMVRTSSDGQLLDKGWVCHEPANNVASKLRRGNDRCQRPVWDLVCTDDPGQAEAIPRV